MTHLMFLCHGVGGIVGSVLTGVFASKAINPAGRWTDIRKYLFDIATSD